jgi:hypothetical protein
MALAAPLQAEIDHPSGDQQQQARDPRQWRKAAGGFGRQRQWSGGARRGGRCRTLASGWTAKGRPAGDRIERHPLLCLAWTGLGSRSRRGPVLWSDRSSRAGGRFAGRGRQRLGDGGLAIGWPGHRAVEAEVGELARADIIGRRGRRRAGSRIVLRRQRRPGQQQGCDQAETPYQTIVPARQIRFPVSTSERLWPASRVASRPGRARRRRPALVRRHPPPRCAAYPRR